MILLRTRLPFAAALLLLAACESGVAETARRMDEARSGCTEEKLRAGDEECVRMMERYVEMGSEAVETYLGALRTLDRALQRQQGAAWDTTGLGRAITPIDTEGGDGRAGGWGPAGAPSFSRGGAGDWGGTRYGAASERRARGPWRDPHGPGGYAAGSERRSGTGFDPLLDPRYGRGYDPLYDPRYDPRYGPRSGQGYDPYAPRYHDPRHPDPYRTGWPAHDPRHPSSYDPRYPAPYDPRFPPPHDARGYGYPAPVHQGEPLYEEADGEYDERWEVRPDLTAGRAADPVRTPPSRGGLRPPEERLRRPEARHRETP